jgi:hypothetical protein
VALPLRSLAESLAWLPLALSINIDPTLGSQSFQLA